MARLSCYAIILPVSSKARSDKAIKADTMKKAVVELLLLLLLSRGNMAYSIGEMLIKATDKSKSKYLFGLYLLLII